MVSGGFSFLGYLFSGFYCLMGLGFGVFKKWVCFVVFGSFEHMSFFQRSFLLHSGMRTVGSGFWGVSFLGFGVCSFFFFFSV